MRPRDRDVQPVAGVEELDLPGQVVTGRVRLGEGEVRETDQAITQW